MRKIVVSLCPMLKQSRIPTGVREIDDSGKHDSGVSVNVQSDFELGAVSDMIGPRPLATLATGTPIET